MKHLEALLGNAIFSALGLVSFVILSRNIPSEIFGQWVLFLSVATFLDMFRFGLTRGAVVRLIAGVDSHGDAHRINASGLWAGVILTLGVTVMFWSLWVMGRNVFSAVYLDILLWYPLVALANLGWNNALTWLQARMQYRHIIVLRAVNMLLFIALTIVILYTDQVSFVSIMIAYITSNVLSSLLSLVMGWDSMKYVRNYDRKMLKEIIQFGKYSSLNNIGSSLLKSADSFIIGLSPVLGTAGIAVYAIPFKVIEMLELPIRSISMVGYSKFSKVVVSGNASQMRGLLARYALMMASLTVPVIVMLGVFPNLVLDVLGGQRYAGHWGEMREMLYMLLLYGVMLVPDRLTGIALEALGKPQLNTIKVLVMAGLNISGDLIAVLYFKSLVGVVFATVVFVTIGVSLGYLMVPPALRPTFEDVIKQSRYLYFRCKIFLVKITGKVGS